LSSSGRHWILAIDSASRYSSVALMNHGEDVYLESIDQPLSATLLLQRIDQLLLRIDLAPTAIIALGFNCGPGSLTGARIGAAMIQGLAWGWGKPVVAVSSLEASAYSCWRNSGCEQDIEIQVLLPGGRDELWYGAFVMDQVGQPHPLVPERLCRKDEIELPRADCRLNGGGWDIIETWRKDFNHPRGYRTLCQVDATHFAALTWQRWLNGSALEPEDAHPSAMQQPIIG